MDKSGKYYIVKERALPEVLLKVVEAKRLIDSEKAMTVQEATDATGISRSSFYKYKDDIIPFHENVHGRTITLSIQLDDEPGLLSGILGKIADYRANILTIHQAIPINGVASLTLSIDDDDFAIFHAFNSFPFTVEFTDRFHAYGCKYTCFHTGRN